MLFYGRKCPQGSAAYTAQADDTFYKICRCYNITLDDLIEANPDIDPDKLHAGDSLCIPISLQKVTCHNGSNSYIVKENDTFFKIAEKFNLKLNVLLKANSRINPDILLPGQILCIPKPWSKYKNKVYKISFLYPSRWARINDLHYEGVDGFFRIGALNSECTLEEICNHEAFHKLKPYGSHPSIVSVAIGDLDGCIVFPSEDQPMEMKKQAALVIQYPQELLLENQSYSHLILWSDVDHINEIKSNILMTD